jgi:ribosomal protein S18 acetylase RimI-like enzyme
MYTIKGVEIKKETSWEEILQFQQSFRDIKINRLEHDLLKSFEYAFMDQSKLFSAWHNGDIVGLLSIGYRQDLYTHENLTFIDGILVHPSYRNQKIGHLLLSESIKDLTGSTERICAFLVSEETKRLFTAFGFKRMNSFIMYEYRFPSSCDKVAGV